MRSCSELEKRGRWCKRSPQLVSTQLCRLVNSGALINRYIDVKLGLVSSARKGNSRDY